MSCVNLFTIRSSEESRDWNEIGALALWLYKVDFAADGYPVNEEEFVRNPNKSCAASSSRRKAISTCDTVSPQVPARTPSKFIVLADSDKSHDDIDSNDDLIILPAQEDCTPC